MARSSTRERGVGAAFSFMQRSQSRLLQTMERMEALAAEMRRLVRQINTPAPTPAASLRTPGGAEEKLQILTCKVRRIIEMWVVHQDFQLAPLVMFLEQALDSLNDLVQLADGPPSKGGG